MSWSSLVVGLATVDVTTRTPHRDRSGICVSRVYTVHCTLYRLGHWTQVSADVNCIQVYRSYREETYRDADNG